MTLDQVAQYLGWDEGSLPRYLREGGGCQLRGARAWNGFCGWMAMQRQRSRCCPVESGRTPGRARRRPPERTSRPLKVEPRQGTGRAQEAIAAAILLGQAQSLQARTMPSAQWSPMCDPAIKGDGTR